MGARSRACRHPQPCPGSWSGAGGAIGKGERVDERTRAGRKRSARPGVASGPRWRASARTAVAVAAALSSRRRASSSAAFSAVSAWSPDPPRSAFRSRGMGSGESALCSASRRPSAERPGVASLGAARRRHRSVLVGRERRQQAVVPAAPPDRVDHAAGVARSAVSTLARRRVQVVVIAAGAAARAERLAVPWLDPRARRGMIEHLAAAAAARRSASVLASSSASPGARARIADELVCLLHELHGVALADPRRGRAELQQDGPALILGGRFRERSAQHPRRPLRLPVCERLAGAGWAATPRSRGPRRGRRRAGARRRGPPRHRSGSHRPAR